MKICPTCGNQWPDETKFCPNDGSTLRSAGGASELIGSVVADRYHIVKKLGEGGMGAVYLGEHVKMGRKSAIKVMTQSMASDPDAIARFNREAANAARITHPNVCAIYDFGETHDGMIYLAMEFIEGNSLTGIIEDQGALPPLRAAKIMQQTAEALQAAHDLGIVHRDLKPDNIMITKGREGADVVKVVDFGIAKAMTGDEGQKVTKTGLVVGTPEYMSPEQLAGDKLDGRSDIYSLALVLFRMLTGTLPFQADSAQETMIKRLTDEPMKLNDAMPAANFPARLQAVLDRALTRMPGERYSSAAEFGRDVMNAVQGMGGAATPPDLEGATQLITAQDAKTAAVAPTRISSVRPGAPGKTSVKTPTTPLPQPSVAAPAKKKPVALVAAIVGVLVVGGGAAAVVLTKGGGGTSSGDSTQLASGGPVTPGTAGQPGASSPLQGSPSRPGTSQPATRQGGALGQAQGPTEPSGTGAVPPPTVAPPAGPTVDSAAIDRELGRLLAESEDETKLTAVRQRAVDIYSNAAYPKSLRAEAASLVSIAYQTEGKMDEACRWVANALIQRPGWQSYQKMQQRLACQ